MTELECRDVRPLVGDYADGLLDEPTAASVRAHLDRCAACAGLLEDLRHVKRAAQGLGPIDPPDHVWLAVAGRLRPGAPAPGAAERPRRSRAVVQWAGLSAALLAVTTVVYVLRGPTPAPTSAVTTAGPSASAAAEVPASVGTPAEDPIATAVEQYDREIAQLQAALGAGSDALEPVAAAALASGGDAVDVAIAESRAAVRESPDSEPARLSLFEALRRKIAMLQATVTLINEMNQGDPAGAARAAEGLGREL